MPCPSCEDERGVFHQRGKGVSLGRGECGGAGPPQRSQTPLPCLPESPKGGESGVAVAVIWHKRQQLDTLFFTIELFRISIILPIFALLRLQCCLFTVICVNHVIFELSSEHTLHSSIIKKLNIWQSTMCISFTTRNPVSINQLNRKCLRDYALTFIV